MKKIVIYISLWAGIFAVSCNKSTPEAPEGIPMSFGTAAVSRAVNLVDSENINQDGNQLTVYDLYTTSEQSVLYMDATQVICDGSGNWTYSLLKYWTETGTHAFTAYLSKQNEVTLDGTNYPTVTYIKNMDALSISPWEITPDNQFDFLYAYHSRSMTGADPHRQVEFELNHLLCAVQFNVVNLMPDPDVEVTLTGFTLSGLHKGSAVIKQGTPTITFDTDATDAVYDFSAGIASEGQNLTFNQAHNLFSNSIDEGYVLLWPYAQNVFQNVTGTISYKYGSTEVSGREIKLIDGGTNNWRAGQKYVYNFYIQDNRISLEVKVVPWKVDDVIIEE